ncbi:MAG: TetR/AcrR family transcriptional regulator [Bacillota bacterium]|nr:TetR/AcrR family transcriptional regulator [Bacillota bacterium]MDW7676901.1 TetR/AcrR family transcriptional regulator [Bacillota bacterium]
MMRWECYTDWTVQQLKGGVTMKSDTKERVLAFARKIILEKGVNHFTLEEVAKQAGISKGGLLYHFPTKEELIKVMLHQYMRDLDSGIGVSGEDNDKQVVVKAILAGILRTGQDTCEYEKNSAGMLAAVVMNKDLMAPIREHHQKWMKQTMSCDDPELAYILFFALAGIRFSTMLGLNELTDEMHQNVLARMVKFAHQVNKPSEK